MLIATRVHADTATDVAEMEEIEFKSLCYFETKFLKFLNETKNRFFDP